MKIGQTAGGNVREIIRAAEKYISSGEYSVALSQLGSAQKMQPDNAYIIAIIERIHSTRERTKSAEGRRAFSGLMQRWRPTLSGTAILSDQREAQIKRLTLVALLFRPRIVRNCI